MLKNAIISGIVFSSILLVGCNEKGEVVVLEDSENGENDADLSPESHFLSELHNEIMESIPEQTELDSESIEAIMLGGNFEEMSVSVSFSEVVKVDDAMIQQIVEDSIKKVSETENVEINNENVTIKIEKE